MVTLFMRLLRQPARAEAIDNADVVADHVLVFNDRVCTHTMVISARLVSSIPRRVFGKRDRHAKGPRADRVLKVPA